MAVKAIGYFLSGVIGSILAAFLGSYVYPLLNLIPFSLPTIVAQGIIVGIFVLVGHFIIHKVLKID